MNDLFPGLFNVTNLHPLFVHFPIALWVVSCGFCLNGAVRNRPQSMAFGRWLLYLGTAGAAAALASGFVAADALGHDSPGHDLVHVHRNFMIAATTCGVVATALAFFLRGRDSNGARWAVALGVLATTAVTALGADRGAQLVYQYGMGVAESPPHHESSSHDHDHGNGHAGHDEPAVVTHEERTVPEPALQEESAPADGPEVQQPATREETGEHRERDHHHHDDHTH